MAIKENNPELVKCVSQAIAKALLENNAPSLCPLHEQVIENGFFSLSFAKKLAETAQKKATELGFSVSVAVVDLSGQLVLFQRMPNTVTASVDYAQHKAYTAAIYQWASGKMDDLIQPASAMMALMNIDPKVTSLAGGLPIQINGKMLGGLGISGGTLDQDVGVAEYVLKQCCEE